MNITLVYLNINPFRDISVNKVAIRAVLCSFSLIFYHITTQAGSPFCSLHGVQGTAGLNAVLPDFQKSSHCYSLSVALPQFPLLTFMQFLYTLVFKNFCFILLNLYMFAIFILSVVSLKKWTNRLSSLYAPADLFLPLQGMHTVVLSCAITTLFC